MPRQMFHCAIALHAALLHYVRTTALSVLWPFWDTCLLFFVDICRLFSGRCRASGLSTCKRPKEPLLLYEFESCPFCRKVRETLSVLDIDHYVYPCPRETLRQSGYCVNSRFRSDVLKMGGRLSFPFLVDPNNNKRMYESEDIIAYLWREYGQTAVAPLNYRIAHWPPFRNMSLPLASFCRPCTDMGALRAPSHRPKETLELWGYEASPFVRRVREVLDVLELPYLMHELPMGSTEKRAAFAEHYGKHFSLGRLRRFLGLCQVPFLKDPNTKKEFFESGAIVRYLKTTYQTASGPAETWWEYGSADSPKRK